MSALRRLNPNPKSPPFDGPRMAKKLLKKLSARIEIEGAFLFGSAATNSHTIDSDIDILVLFSDIDSIKKAYQVVGEAFFSSVAVDWIFKLTKDFEMEKNRGGVSFMAFHYGKKMS